MIYRFQVLKQADVVLALFLQGEEFTAEAEAGQTSSTTTRSPPATRPCPRSCSRSSPPRSGYHELALRYFYQALFVDLADLHANASDGVHVASAGGVWSALVYGFGGMRDHGGAWTIDPRLPEEWTALTYRLTLQGTRLRVRVEPHQVSLTVEDGDQVEITVRGKLVQVTPGEPVVVPLDGQGPRLPGDPPAWVRDGVRRSDGTVITASVPHAGSLQA